MHLHWERSNNSAGDCHINALSWMGRVPEEIPEVKLTFECNLLHFGRMSFNFGVTYLT